MFPIVGWIADFLQRYCSARERS